MTRPSCARKIARNESESECALSALRTAMTRLCVAMLVIGKNLMSVRLFIATLRPTTVAPRPAATRLNVEDTRHRTCRHLT